MKIEVRHRTTYTFDPPRRRVLQSHRLTPSAFDGQSVVDWTIDSGAGIVGAEFRDGAGDLTQTVSLPGLVEVVDVSVAGIVETTDLSGLLRGFRERVPPMAYLRTTRVTRIDKAITDLAGDAVSGAKDRLGQAHALSAAVSEAIEYQADTTKAHTTAAEALTQGSGVCQDHAHVLIAAAQVCEIPARYVAGYMLAAADGSSQGAEASHAWAELHIDGLGWVGFDATNQMCPDDRYIRLCSGYDAFDAAPIRGLVPGQGSEDLDVHVAVEAVQQ